jgi:phosphohistidine phosphatase SixA
MVASSTSTSSTVRTLLLMRHAHAVMDASNGGANDKSRALTPAGCEEAKRIGTYFADKLVFPDLIISSDSERTKQTLQNVLDGLKGADGWNRDNVTIRYNPVCSFQSISITLRASPFKLIVDVYMICDIL